MTIFLAMNLTVIFSAVILTKRCFKFDDFIGSSIAAFLLYLSQIIITELVLGIFGRLNLMSLILLNLTVLIILLAVVRQRPISPAWPDLRKDIVSLLKDKPALFLAAIILVFGCVKIAINLVNPPFGWDSLNYHFTFAVEWLKQANLNTPITVFDDPSPSYYPLNGSLFYLWLIFPLRNVFLADLGQLPFFILSFFAVYSIARKLGIAKPNAFYCAGLFLIIPNFFKQLSIAYVDVMVAALFLACVSFLLSLDKKFSFTHMLFYSISLGLLLGVKTVALPYCVLLFLPFIYLCVKNFKRIYYLAVCLFIVIALGGFSYIRNFLQAGNPLYPLELNFAGWAIFKGVMASSTYRAHFKPEDYRLAGLLFHEGLGAQTMIFVLPGIILAIPAAMLKKVKGLDFIKLYLLILPFLVYLVYRYLIPLANARYLYPLLGLGMVSGFYLAQILNVPKKAVSILVFLCCLASMSELAKRIELAVSIPLALAAFFVLPFIIRALTKRKPKVFLYLLITAFLLLIPLQRIYLKNEFPRYKKMVKYSGFWVEAAEAWNWLNSHSAGNNIAYAGRPVPFPLYGSGFKNNVYYVSVNSTDPAKLHYFSGSRYRWGHDFLGQHRNFTEPGNYRGEADYGVWSANLMRRKCDFLFVYSLHQTKEVVFPMEDAWAVAHPEKFQLVFTNKIVHVYKIKR